MSPGPGGKNVTVAGGDNRQCQVAKALVAYGFSVKVLRLPCREEFNEIIVTNNWQEAMSPCDVLVLPISGVTPENEIRTADGEKRLFIDEDFWRYVPLNLNIIAGSWPEHLHEKSRKKNLKVFEYAECDEIAVPNAIPTAEGALQIAINEIPITISGADVLVLGFGRVSAAVARLFAAAGAKIHVAARRSEMRAIAVLSGYQAVTFMELPAIIGGMDVVINTVPAPVLTRELICRMKKEALIIDLASSPGGTDFQAAEESNIKAILALGLPGKIAPKTAGRILASTLPKIILRELGLT